MGDELGVMAQPNSTEVSIHSYRTGERERESRDCIGAERSCQRGPTMFGSWPVKGNRVVGQEEWGECHAYAGVRGCPAKMGN